MVKANIVKFITLLSLIVAIPFTVNGQIKVLEKSAKKVPGWLVSTGNGYFVASNKASSLEAARELCLEDIKRQIISAVAENIKSTTSQHTTQVTGQNQIIDFNEEFMAKFETRSAVVPFINGISLSKAEDYYYEKTQDKSSGITSYSYSVLYPFSEGELRSLISKFNAQDREMEKILNQQIEKLDDINSTEDIDRGISNLTPLLDYFFDDVRIAKTEQTYQTYKKLYSYISLEMVSSSPGNMVYAMMLNGRTITTGMKPAIRSNCAMSLSYSGVGDNMVKVTYDNGGCLDGEDNWVEVSYRLPYTALKRKLYPVMTNTPLRISATGQMIVKLGEVDTLTNMVDGVKLEFQLNNLSSAAAEVRSISLKLKELGSTINESGLNIALANGISAINISSLNSYKLVELSTSKKLYSLPFVNGSIDVVNQSTGAVQSIPIVVKYELIY